MCRVLAFACRVTLRLRLAPGPYRLPVRAEGEDGLRSRGVRRWVRVLA